MINQWVSSVSIEHLDFVNRTCSIQLYSQASSIGRLACEKKLWRTCMFTLHKLCKKTYDDKILKILGNTISGWNFLTLRGARMSHNDRVLRNYYVIAFITHVIIM